MHITSYIGVFDVRNYTQVQRLIGKFEKYQPPESNRRLQVGVTMNHNVLKGLPSKWSASAAPVGTIADIFSSPKTMNCLIYIEHGYDPDLPKNLARAIEYGGSGINTLQLNMIWPNRRQIEHGIYPSVNPLEIILKVGRDALGQARFEPKQVVERLRKYEGLIHHVLLDTDKGMETNLNSGVLIPHIEAIRENLPTLGITLQGGFGPRTMHLARPIIAIHKDISVIAQGRLRPSGDALLEQVNWDMATDFIKEAHALFA